MIVSHLPSGTAPITRTPRGARPLSLTMFVLTAVSSINTAGQDQAYLALVSSGGALAPHLLAAVRLLAGLMGWRAPPHAGEHNVFGQPIRREQTMQLAVLGIDLGKNKCSIVGLNSAGAVVLRRRLRREGVIEFTTKLKSCVVAMEACCASEGRTADCAGRKGRRQCRRRL